MKHEEFLAELRKDPEFVKWERRLRRRRGVKRALIKAQIALRIAWCKIKMAMGGK